ETGNVRNFEMFEGHPLDAQTIKRILLSYQIITFNGWNYDLPLLLLAVRHGSTNEILKRASDSIIVNNYRGWQFLDRHNLTLPKWLDHIDLYEVAPGVASLKIYGGRLHCEKMQDLPYDPSASIGAPERELLKLYNINDLKTTTALFEALKPQIALRERMGIENNYATQVEETARVEGKREENFYKRQADNFAQLEKNMQKVTKLFGELEDSLSQIIGAKTSTRGFGKIFNTLGNLGIPGMNALGNFLGDPAGAGAETSRIASTKPTSAPKYGAMLEKLKPQMRDPLERMLKDAGGRVGIGQTYRSSDEQKKMFLERYYKTDKKTGTFWNGSYWEKKPGVAAATPPGMSMHEIGLAADLTGDLEWVKKNAG
ncbi:MAG: hypothetical protein EBU33_10115, partial [Sphingobacteriia bacterium]|nr:hypothetical protein [Sphingobacteriia bacterium]